MNKLGVSSRSVKNRRSPGSRELFRALLSLQISMARDTEQLFVMHGQDLLNRLTLSELVRYAALT